MDIEKNVHPGKVERVRGISKEHRPIYDLPVRDPVTKQGDAVVIPHSAKNYNRYVKSLLPRWNKRFAPMHWVHSSDYRKGKRVILIQRSA